MDGGSEYSSDFSSDSSDLKIDVEENSY